MESGPKTVFLEPNEIGIEGSSKLVPERAIELKVEHRKPSSRPHKTTFVFAFSMNKLLVFAFESMFSSFPVDSKVLRLRK